LRKERLEGVQKATTKFPRFRKLGMEWMQTPETSFHC